jgi:hypothetical protein
VSTIPTRASEGERKTRGKKISPTWGREKPRESLDCRLAFLSPFHHHLYLHHRNTISIITTTAVTALLLSSPSFPSRHSELTSRFSSTAIGAAVVEVHRVPVVRCHQLIVANSPTTTTDDDHNSDSFLSPSIVSSVSPLSRGLFLRIHPRPGGSHTRQQHTVLVIGASPPSSTRKFHNKRIPLFASICVR